MFLEYVQFPLRHSRKRPRRWCGRRSFVFYLRARAGMLELTWKPWFGICVTATWSRWRKGGTLNPPTRRLEVPSVKKRSPAGGGESQKHLAALESSILRDLLPLVEHCSIRQYDDGSPRQPGWITLRTNGAAWQVQVKEPDGGCSFVAVGQTVDDALQTAALLLACEEAPWEPDPYLAAQKKRKK